MFRKSTFLNLTLAILAGLLAFRVYHAWVGPPPIQGIGPRESRESGPPGDKEAEEPGAKGARARPGSASSRAKKPVLPSIADYAAIGEKNLFRPERKEWVPPAVAAAEQPQLTSPASFKLVGVVTMLDGSQVALMEETSTPATPAGRPSFSARRRLPFPRPGASSEPNRAERYRINDTIGGHRIVDIQRDKVVLEAGGQRAEVLLRDPDNPKQRPAAPAVAMAPPPPMPSAAGAVRPPVPPPTFSPTPTATPPQVSPPQPPGVAPGRPAAALPSPGTPTPPRARGRQVIQTPFGPRVIYR